LLLEIHLEKSTLPKEIYRVLGQGRKVVVVAVLVVGAGFVCATISTPDTPESWSLLEKKLQSSKSTS